MFWPMDDHEVEQMKGDLGVSLAAFIKGKSQAEVAEMIGVTQGAVSQMLRSRRDIRIRGNSKDGYEAFEIRVVGARQARQAA